MSSTAFPRTQAKSLRKRYGRFCGRKIFPPSARYFSITFLVIVLAPFLTSAQVVISEIMYDAPGTEGSGDHDWIEVFNAGSSDVDLSSYRFFEANTNHTLKSDQGSATLPVGGYAVIANIPTTFKIDWPSYIGAIFDSSFNLNSTGELIGIRTGDLADTDAPFTYVPEDASTNNGSSLHRTNVSAGTFSASAATPGSGSLTASSGSSSDASSSSSNSQTSTTTQTTTTSTTISSPVSSYVTPPEIQIFADGGDDRTVIVGADTEFYGRAYNRDKEEITHVRFMWNFGDGSTAEGMTVLHHFDYPGRYAVVLNIAENRSAASDVIVVEALPAQLSFEVEPDGSVSIGNGAGRDLDLSRWIVRSFGREFILPDHSLILEGAAMHIIQKTLGVPAGLQTELAYPNGVVALRAGENTSATDLHARSGAAAPPPTVSLPPVSVLSLPSLQPISPKQNIGEIEITEQQNMEERGVKAATSSEVAAGATFAGGSWKWWLGAFGLALAGSGVAFAARRFGKREWNIIEESPK